MKSDGPTFELERVVRARLNGDKLVVVGIDECGVGALAGPLVAAAVALDERVPWLGQLRDSKQLTRKRREELASLIHDQALIVEVVVVPNVVIDAMGLAAARRAVVARAFALASQRGAQAAVVDDRRLSSIREQCGGSASIFIDKADERSYSVAAASIVAKTARDRDMRRFDEAWPRYRFAAHVGYGTRAHLEALRRWGPCPLHRLSTRPVREALAGTPDQKGA